MFQDEIQANVDKAKELDKMKPPKKERSPAEVRAAAERKKVVDRNGYLAYQCQCRSCLYKRGFLNEGGLLQNDYDNL